MAVSLHKGQKNNSSARRPLDGVTHTFCDYMSLHVYIELQRRIPIDMTSMQRRQAHARHCAALRDTAHGNAAFAWQKPIDTARNSVVTVKDPDPDTARHCAVHSMPKEGRHCAPLRAFAPAMHAPPPFLRSLAPRDYHSRDFGTPVAVKFRSGVRPATPLPAGG